MKKDFLFLSLLLAFYGSCLGGVRAALELYDKPEFTQESVRHIEIYGFNNYVFFEHSNESTTIWYMHNSFESASMIDYNNDGLVDKIQIGDNEALRNGSRRFLEADRKFRRYCDILDCESLIEDWINWENNNHNK